MLIIARKKLLVLGERLTDYINGSICAAEKRLLLILVNQTQNFVQVNIKEERFTSLEQIIKISTFLLNLF